MSVHPAGGAQRRLAVALPTTAIVALLGIVGLAAWSASVAGTLGFDFLSYDSAVRRFLAGGVLYDQSFDTTGPFGLFYYPPPFVLLAIPLTILPPALAAWVVTGLLVATFLAGVAILPISLQTRWIVVLLGALSWPLVYAIKLGQVGPILFLTFAIGWRWMDRPARLGLATAVGTAIKLQPIVVLGWALLTRRRRAVTIGLLAFLALAIAGSAVAGPGAWADQLGLLARLSRPVTTPHNVTPGRLVFEAGVGDAAAWAVQVLDWILIAGLVLYAIARTTDVASYLAVVVASQAVSPILWDHYALMLLLPVAWLIERGRWWAAAIPLAMSVPLVTLSPPAVYPAAYLVTLVLVILEGRRDRARQPRPEVLRLAPAPGGPPLV